MTPRRRRRTRLLRAEPGTRGYRGIFAVLGLIALVASLAVTGVVRQGLCLIDSSTCVSGPAVPRATTGFDTGELPAPTDELAVYTGAGPGSVPADSTRQVRGQQAQLNAGTASSSGSLWSAPQSETLVPSTSTTLFLPLDALPCGSATTGPCDAWEGLQTDSTADQTAGPHRLALLGLDPFLGIESEENVVDFTATRGTLQTSPSAGSSLYRHAERVRDGMTTATWTWQDPTDSSIKLLRIERTREGTLHSTMIVSATALPDGQIRWGTVRVPVTDSSRDAVEQWLTTFLSKGPFLPDGIVEPTGPVGSGDDILLRLAHETGEVSRETLAPGPGFPGLSPQLVRDDPGRSGMDLAVVSAESLAAADDNGYRSFTVQGTP